MSPVLACDILNFACEPDTNQRELETLKTCKAGTFQSRRDK
jgi:hypothetical protein